MILLSKIISWIDRDKVVEITNNIEEPTNHHEVVNLTCDRCKATKLYLIGTETDYFLHCFACDKVEKVVSL